MKEILNRLHYILTGKEISEVLAGNMGAVGTGTVDNCRVFVGWDQFRDKIPSGYYPIIVLEPGSEAESRAVQSQARLPVSLDIAVEVPGKLGALFGKTPKKGILEIEADLKTILWDKDNQKLKMNDKGYTSYIESINCTPSISLESLWIGKRYVTITVEYSRVRFVGIDA